MNANRWVLDLCNHIGRLVGNECVARLYVSPECEGALHALTDTSIADWENAPMAEMCLQYASALRSTVCLPAGQARYQYAIPIASEDLLPWFAIGTLRASSESEANRLLNAANEAAVTLVSLERQKLGSAAASRHVTRIMQEQNWLRDLAAMTRIEHAPLGLEKVTTTILEPLQRVLQAETVGLYVGETLKKDTRHPDSRTISSVEWSNEDIVALLKDVPLPAPDQLVHHENLEKKLPHGVAHSAIIGCIEVSPTSRCYLVAINHFHIDAHYRTALASFDQHELGLFHEAISHLGTFYSNLQVLMEGEQLVLDTLRAMSQAIEVRDPYTRGHSDRVAKIAGELARRMGLSNDECQQITLAGVLHDIGKIGVPDHILMKPGRLTPEEQAVIQRHPEIGYSILKSLGKLKFTLPGVLYHHERWDGQGYPHRLAAEDIPLMARILAVADAFDAMSTSRPYRVAMSLEKTKSIMLDGSGSFWDASIIEVLMDWIEEQGELTQQRDIEAHGILDQNILIKQSPEAPLSLMLQLTTVPG